MSKLLLFVAFTTGASVMVIELVGSRIIAPSIGASIFVWTALIGVVLASLSIGYTLGGRLADKGANLKTLSTLLFIASLATAGIIIFKSVGISTGILAGGLRFSAIIVATLLFTPSTLILGMITPYVARLQISDLASSGKAIGNLYAISTLGSIVGTFAGGFVLISFFGSEKIILGTALVLLILSIIVGIVSQKKRLPIKTALGVLVILIGISLPSNAPVKGTLVYDGDTEYRRVWIYDTTEPLTGRPVRLFTDTTEATHSGIRLDSNNELYFDYNRYFDLADFFVPNFSKTLMIGGAVQTYPMHFTKEYPERTMDSVEIDPDLLPLARKYFSFKDTPQIKTIHEDGRIFLNTATTSYDVIFVDAFTSLLTVPFQLATTEAIGNMERLLNKNGVVIVNMISTIEGRGNNFFRSMYSTYKSQFSNVYIFDASTKEDTGLSNIVLVATNNPDVPIPPFVSTNQQWQTLLNTYHDKPIAPGMVLTDDFAPVEKLVTQAFING